MALSTQADARRGGLVLMSIAASMVVLAGCGGKDQDKAVTAPSPTTATSTDPQSKVKAEILRVYRSYWDAQVKAYAKASPVGTDLDKYAFDKALGKAEVELVQLKLDGEVIKGEPKISPKVTAVSLEESPKKATISDCVDVTDWKLLKAKTGQEVKLPKERLTKFVTTISARTVGDKWMIVETQQQDRTC